MSPENDDQRPQPQYDEEEARQILANHLQSVDPEHGGPARAAAAALLFAETAALCRELGYQVKHGDSLEIRSEVGSTAHAWYADGEVITVGSYQLKRTGEPRALPLRFNPFTKKLEGIEEDTFRVPVQGQPRARRAAKALLAEALVAALNVKASTGGGSPPGGSHHRL
ncbi:MAG TPA: hypothetical protein VIG99_24360 [Myxococcaceae bacterium]|jgi:hypothetical protein